MSENKVQFGLKNVHYAILTEGTTNSWATPVHVPGAVNLSMDANIATVDFKADNVTYFRTAISNGYEGTLEMARIPDAMYQAIWGDTLESTDKYLIEKTGVQPKPFALLFQIDGDQENEFYCLYRCVPTGRPPVAGATVEDAIEPQTQSFDIAALPLVTGSATQLDLIKAKTTATTTSTVKSGWFDEVTIPD